MTETSLRPGRPRDPDVDRRVAQAAVAQFGEAGWQGFSVEAVARRAGVGKASIYLRWPTKSELLLDALKSSLGRIEDIARDFGPEVARLVAAVSEQKLEGIELLPWRDR